MSYYLCVNDENSSMIKKGEIYKGTLNYCKDRIKLDRFGHNLFYKYRFVKFRKKPRNINLVKLCLS